jgi:hypothetical protein
MGYLVVAILAAAVAVFALQNSEPGLGLVVVGLPLWIRSWRWRSRALAAEARVATLDKALAEREQALMRRPPPPPESPGARQA